MIGNRIRQLRISHGLNQTQFAKRLYVTPGAVSQWEKGQTRPDTDRLLQIAREFGVPLDYFNDTSEFVIGTNILPVHPRSVPILGDIACGTPITAEQNIEGYADLPDGVRADFALRCKGDSMAPTFQDGDLVLIRQAEDVPDGKIAAIMLDADTASEATLKRIHHTTNGLILIPDNQQKYGPLTYQGKEAASVRILGVAVGYVRMF